MLTSAPDYVPATVGLAEVADQVWDVIVIGSGPAGSLAALELAKHHRKVLLVEKNAHPRYKVCGGCLGAAALQILREAGLAYLVEALPGHATTRLSLRLPGNAHEIGLPTGLSVSRETFDATLARAAVSAGASYLDHTSAKLIGVDKDRCHLRFRSGDLRQPVSAKLVLAADGLAGTSLRDEPRFATTVKATSRIGLGAMFDAADLPAEALIEAGTVGMHYAPGGYVGLVRVERDRLNLAAALDPTVIRAAGSPAAAIVNHLEATGLHCPPLIKQATYTGSPALTRQRNRLAIERVMVIGDATGYVEPFTGEGMTWAMLSALLVVPLVLEAIGQWHSGIAVRWEQVHAHAIGKKQRACRVVSLLSKHTMLCNTVIRLLARQPRMARAVTSYVSGVGRTTRLLQSERASRAPST